MAPETEETATATLAMLQGLVPNEGDGWEWTLEELQRYFEQVSVVHMPEERFPRANVALTEMSEHPESEWRAITWGRIWTRRRCSGGARRRCTWRWASQLTMKHSLRSR